jgi:hypothetical protein
VDSGRISSRRRATRFDSIGAIATGEAMSRRF